MSITFLSAYTAAVSAPNAVTDWLLRIDSDGTPVVFLSGSDRDIETAGDNQFYHGVVLDWGDIDETLDLKKCATKISDITIKVANVWHNASGTLGAELFDGTDNYLYQDVILYGWAASCTNIQDCPALYRGRLIDIEEDNNGDTLKLTIEPRTPWDYIKVPQDKTTEGKYFPVVYGNYIPETSNIASPQYCDGAFCWPMPI